MHKLWRAEPVVILAVLFIVVMLVQKIWLGEVITQDWIEWVLGLFGLATGAGVLRQSVYSKKTIEGEPLEMEDHNGDNYL